MHYDDRRFMNKPSGSNGEQRFTSKIDFDEIQKKTLSALIRMLSDTDPRVRSAAILCLTQHKHPLAILHLIKHLRRDKSVNVRAMCAASLEMMRNPESLSQYTHELIGALEDHDSKVVFPISKVLRRYGCRNSTSQLLRLLGHSQWFTKLATCQILVEWKVFSPKLELVIGELAQHPEARLYMEWVRHIEQKLGNMVNEPFRGPNELLRLMQNDSN